MIEFLVNTLIGFVLGIVSSIVASVIHERHQAKKSESLLASLSGYWFEVVPKSEGRNFSIGRFQFNRHTKSYNFDGANYRNDGQIFCTWESTHVHADLKHRKIYYIFRACLKGERHNENFGFGVLDVIENDSGLLEPVSGHYIETKEDAKPFSHSMERLTKVASDLKLTQGRENIEEFHSKVVKKYGARYTKTSKRSV